MKVLPEDTDDPNEPADYDKCPFCDKWIGDLADAVSDDDERENGEAVASGRCPSCNEDVAIVRQSSFSLRKFASK